MFFRCTTIYCRYTGYWYFCLFLLQPINIARAAFSIPWPYWPPTNASLRSAPFPVPQDVVENRPAVSIPKYKFSMIQLWFNPFVQVDTNFVRLRRFCAVLINKSCFARIICCVVKCPTPPTPCHFLFRICVSAKSTDILARPLMGQSDWPT